MRYDYTPLPPLRGTRYAVRLDEKNRLYLSPEAMRHLGVPNGGELELTMTEEEEICLSPLLKSCDVCGDTTGLEARGGFYFCKHCLEQLDHGTVPEE